MNNLKNNQREIRIVEVFGVKYLMRALEMRDKGQIKNRDIRKYPKTRVCWSEDKGFQSGFDTWRGLIRTEEQKEYIEGGGWDEMGGRPQKEMD